LPAAAYQENESFGLFGWESRPGGRHEVFKHPQRKGRIIVPRHRTLSPGVARAIAKAAGWMR
jgi:predicted RNA binding protein YcfA (HicA-like mRNA interferase family)